MVEQPRHIKHNWSKQKLWLLLTSFFLLSLILFWGYLNQDIRKLSLDYPIGPVAFSPDGRFLVAGERHISAQVRVWDLQTGQILSTIKTGHDHGVGLLAISPDSKLIATCSIEDDMQLLLWDLQTGRNVGRLKAELSFIHSLFFSKDSRILVNAGYSRLADKSGVIEIWEVRKNLLLHRILEAKGDLFAASMSNGKNFLTASSNGIKLRDLRSGKALKMVSNGSGKECVQAVLTPNDRTLALGTRASQGQPENIELWDIQNSKLRLSISENSGAPWGTALTSLAFSGEYGLMASNSLNPQVGKGEVRVRDAKTGLSQATLKLEAQSLAFSPDGKTLAVGTQREVQLWKVDALLSEKNRE